MFLGGGEFGVFPCHLGLGVCNQKILTDTHPIWGRQRKKKLILHIELAFKQKEVNASREEEPLGFRYTEGYWSWSWSWTVGAGPGR